MDDNRIRNARHPLRRFAGNSAWLTLSIVVLTLALVGGCGGNKKSSLTAEEIDRLTQAQQPEPAGVLLVSGERITYDEIVGVAFERGADATLGERLVEFARVAPRDQFIEQARGRVLLEVNNRITNIILYRWAARELGDGVEEGLNQMVEKEFRRFVLENGGNSAAAEAALQERGTTRAAYKESLKKEILTQYALSSRLSSNRPVSYSELVTAYEEMKDPTFVDPGLVQFRLIDIQVSQMAAADPNSDPLATARALAEHLVTRACDGDDFGAMAEQYSHGFRASAGGLWPERDPEALAEPYDVLADIALKIEPGEIAGPIVAPGRFFVMKLEQKQAKRYRPLADVQEQVEARIRADRRAEALQALDAEIAEQAEMASTERFVTDCLGRLYREATSAARTQ
jgi:hypothetical protein